MPPPSGKRLAWLAMLEAHTRLVELARTDAGDDGRGVFAELTASGLETFARMEDSHARSIATHFSAHVSRDEAQTMSAAFARITAAIGATSPTSSGGDQ